MQCKDRGKLTVSMTTVQVTASMRTAEPAIDACRPFHYIRFAATPYTTCQASTENDSKLCDVITVYLSVTHGQNRNLCQAFIVHYYVSYSLLTRAVEYSYYLYFFYYNLI